MDTTKILKFVEDAGKAIADTTVTVLNESKKISEEKILPAAKGATALIQTKVTEIKDSASNKSVELLDMNGDGKLDQEDMLILLDNIYGQAVNGIPKISAPVNEICEEYLSRYKDPRKAAEKMIASDIAKCTTSGFLTGFGGFITLPVTLPANVTSVIYVQIRMIASVANFAGLDVNSDACKTLTYACLAGVSLAEVVKKTGLKIGEKLTMSVIKKIPGKTLTAINQKVGFRFLTKFGSKGLINLGKMVPFVGAIIGGGFDLVETKVISDRALKQFFDGNFEIDKGEDFIEVEFEDESVELDTVDTVAIPSPKNDQATGLQSELDKIKLLKEYKELLDMGIITQEEFEQKKSELLG